MIILISSFILALFDLIPLSAKGGLETAMLVEAIGELAFVFVGLPVIGAIRERREQRRHKAKINSFLLRKRRIRAAAPSVRAKLR